MKFTSDVTYGIQIVVVQSCGGAKSRPEGRQRLIMAGPTRPSGVSLSSIQRQVHHALELLAGGDTRGRQNLYQEDADHVLFGIDPEGGARGAAPIVRSFRADRGGLAWPRINRKRQAEAEALRQKSRAREIAEMIAAHQLHRLAGQNPHAVE